MLLINRSIYLLTIVMMNSPALVLVCKRPRLGHGKQRLARHLGLEVAQHVAEALLACAVEDACNWPGPVVIAPANPHDYDWAITLAKPIKTPVMVVPQLSGNLGQRLNSIDKVLRSQGIDQLVYIGSDSPALSVDDYFIVRKTLQRYDTVLKPASDGGVVLMSSCCPWPELSDLPWSTDQLGISLMNVCHKAGHSVISLEKGYDVDELDDFMRLITQLEADQRPARRTLRELVSHISFADK